MTKYRQKRISDLRRSARESAAFDYERRRPAKEFPEWQEADRLEALADGDGKGRGIR